MTGHPILDPLVSLDPDPSGHPRERADSRVAKHSGLLSISSGVVGVLSYSCTLLMVNALKPADYSHFAAGQMLLGMVGIVTSALVPLPLSHAVAAHPQGSEARRDGMAFAAMVSFIAGLAAAVITGLVTAALASPLMAAVVALSSLVLFMGAAPSGWLQGELRFVRYAMKSVVEVSARLLFSLLVILLLSWHAPGAILGFTIGGFALLVVPRSYYRDLSWRPRVLLEKWRWVETADIALTLCIVSVLAGADVVVVAFLDAGSNAAAGFQALASIAKAPVYVAAGTVLVTFPLLRRPGAQTDKVLRSALRSFGQLALVAFAVIATAPHALIALVLPQRYYASLGLLPWLALAGLGYAAIIVLATVLLALRAYRRCQLGLVIASVLVPSGLVVGWKLNGVSGLAVGSATGAMLATLVLASIAYALLPPRSAQMTVRGLAAATGLAIVLMVAGLQPVVWLLVVLGVGLAVLAHQRGRNVPGLGIIIRLSQSSLVPKSLRRLWDSDAGLSPEPAFDRRLSHPEDAPGPKPGYVNVWGGRHSAAGSAPIRRRSLTLLLATLTVTGLAFAVRSVGLTRGFELWVDEILYAQLGQSAGSGHWPRLPDGPFFLHPPGFFLLEGCVINLFRISGDIMNVVMDLRWLNASLGAVSVGLSFLLVRRVGSRRVAWASAAVLSFEPFVLRNNSHLFLETLGMATVLAGLLLLVRSIQQPTRSPSVRPLVFAGLLMGYGILTKEFFVICTILPVVIAVLWRHTLRPRVAGVLLTGMVIPYAIYFTVVIVQGMLPDWISAKVNGVQRFIGVEKTTGFTAEGSPSLVSRLLDQAGHYGTSYLLLAICPVAGAILCFSRRRERRLIGLVGLALGAYGIYSAVFGTFEEQYGYPVMIAAVLSSVVLGAELVERRGSLRRSVTTIAVGFMVFTVILGIRTETTIDDGFVQVEQWVQQNLPADAKVTVTNGTAELAFAGDKRFGVWPSAPLMEKNGAQYVLTQSLPTRQGYGYAQPRMLAWLNVNGHRLFSVNGPTNGTTTIWFVDAVHLQRAAAAGIGDPPDY